MVVPKHSAKPLAAFDLAVSLTDFVAGINDPVVQGLAITLPMIMVKEFVNRVPQGTSIERQQSPVNGPKSALN